MEQNNLDIELLQLTNKINKVSIEMDVFKKWFNEEWKPFKEEMRNNYCTDDESNMLNDALEEYLKEKESFIIEKYFTGNKTINAICLRQFLHILNKYRGFKKSVKSNNKNKSDDTAIDQFDLDENITKLERKEQLKKENNFFKNSKHVNFWLTTLFKECNNNYELIENSINSLKNKLSKPLHSNSLFFFSRTKDPNDEVIEMQIKNILGLINKKIMISTIEEDKIIIIDSDSDSEYIKWRETTEEKFRFFLAPLIDLVSSDLANYIDKLSRMA